MAVFHSPLGSAKSAVETRARLRFTVEDYHHLMASGIFDEVDRIELINGDLTMMPPIGPEHSSHTTGLTNKLPRKLPETLLVRINEPITIGTRSEPQPDVAIVRARKDNYKTAHPGPKDVLLVIEVADSSAPFDNEVKAKLYGKAGIPEYWVIDIAAECVRVFTGPSAKGYKHITENHRGEPIKCGTIPQLKLTVNEVLV